MDQVIIFDKSLQQRLQEYNSVLVGSDTLPYSSIQKEWGFFLELTLDPNGWQAVWKIPRKTCEKLNISFPSIALVLVLRIDFAELRALVKILAVQDDIHLPDRNTVPLVQLWITKDQDKSVVLNLESTANSLDMLRFFYNNLLMPWDYELDDDIDWKSRHLEGRLRLYYDTKNGVLPRVTAEHLHSLVTEAKRLHSKREELESEIQSDDENLDDDNKTVQDLMEIHIRMMEIKSEFDILENPLLRGALVKKHKETLIGQNNLEKSIWVIYNEGTATNCVDFLSKVDKIHPNTVLKFSPNLISVLEYANPGDLFILKESEHKIKNTGVLENGGCLKGISGMDKTVVTSDEDDLMLDFKAGHATVENLTIEAVKSQCAIIVRSGKLTLKNCKLVGDGKSSTHQGIIVLNGGTLEIFHCEVSNFCTAIVGNSGSSILIENSNIFGCNVGIKVFDNSKVKASKVTFRDCASYGFCVETEMDDGSRVGDFDILNRFSNLKLEFVTGSNNAKGDAIVNSKPKLRPLEDLFDNGDNDPTIYDPDEEMETPQNSFLE